jgi:hypothetical protein
MESNHKLIERCSARSYLESELLLRKAIGTRIVLLILLCVNATIMLSACGGGSSASTGPGAVTVIVQPANANLFLGQTQQFHASVTGTANTSVAWSVNGVTGGNANVGTVSESGAYTAPGTLPSPASVTVTAVSQADPQASASASVMLHDNIVVSLAPNAVTVPTGGAQIFTAGISATGSPATGVTWSVNEIAGGNSTVGTIVPNGADSALYTAPGAVPSPAAVNVTATSAADTSKSGSASVTIACTARNSISPSSASVALGQTQTFTASFCLAPGGTIGWDVNGIAGGNSTLGTIVPNGANSALFAAPADIPAANPVTIHATAGSATASAIVTLTSSISVVVSPSSASVPVAQRVSFVATITNTSDTTALWSVNGIPNGSAIVGRICVPGSNPCASPAAPISGSVDFLSPASVPATNPVTVTAASNADPSKSGSATVAITGPSGGIAVAVTPSYAFVAPSGAALSTQQFFAAVTGSPNPNVTWSVQSAVAGQGCAGAACGSVDGNGLYTAPSAAPSPNAISVIATSEADSTKSASATASITSGPVIETILPSSVMAGAVESFPFEVEGLNFVPGSGSAASTILINGTARGTTCATAESCATALNPSDVQSAATLTIQVQNPGSPGALSNPVPFVIVPFDVSEGVLSLTSAQPAATGINLIVTEPTTAAASAPIDVDLIGFLTGGNNCGIGASPLTVTRPSSGSTIVSLCIHGTGLDPSFAYTFTTPSGAPGGDIGVTASAISGLFPNMIELELQISSTTLPGLRTLFITTLNSDRAASTGMLEVQ